MKNGLTDLVDHLFAQVERLSDESANAETIAQEIARTGALEKLSARIIDAGRLALDAQRAAANLDGQRRPPALLGMEKMTDGGRP